MRHGIMAATVLGTAHLYGVTGTVTNATVLSFRYKTSCKNTAETMDESGNEIERRYDDLHVDATIVIRLRAAYTIPAIASVFTYDSVAYEIVDIEKNTTQKGFRELTMNVKNSAGITYV
jgi:hypothetical protein